MIKSMIESFSNIFKKPLTHAYPSVPIPKSAHYRGLIQYTEAECIFCDRCEKVCPTSAIVFTQDLDGTKHYHYNHHLCIYCGECTRNCPKIDLALTQSSEKPGIELEKSEQSDAWKRLQEKAKEDRIKYKQNKKKPS
ncbi:4Fe-4S binding protein [Sulfurospirillum sp. 1612]|uniref:4Fe-4S binding protein n=1 Tax=Sulfurospirillum sp. 1612 TaxID=3094835 RepID=UPI002F9229F7